RARRLLVLVFVVAAVTTAVLSLDATVVLLTPVVFATAARVGARPRPEYSPGELGVVAAAGLQLDQPARVRRQRAGVPPVRGADDAAVGSRGRH
ncbi:MAG TPA: hypothetical protein VIV12_06810, partial [Streptosporangiaceae bacterium]